MSEVRSSSAVFPVIGGKNGRNVDLMVSGQMTASATMSYDETSPCRTRQGEVRRLTLAQRRNWWRHLQKLIATAIHCIEQTNGGMSQIMAPNASPRWSEAK